MKNKLLEEKVSLLAKAWQAEQVFQICCQKIIEYIKNGAVKSKFTSYCIVSQLYQKKISGYLNGFKEYLDKNQYSCEQCKVNPESFSLVGALKLALEVIKVSLAYYRQLFIQTSDKEQQQLFKNIFKEKKVQYRNIKKELNYHLDKENKKSVFEDFCIPHLRKFF